MATARPMNHQTNLSAFLLHINDDLANQDSHDSLFQSHVGRRRVPNYRQILCQTQKPLFTRRRYRLAFGVEVMPCTFKPLHFLPSSIPASFQFCSDQPLIGIDGFISPSCQTCFVASLLELPLNGSAQIASLL